MSMPKTFEEWMKESCPDTTGMSPLTIIRMRSAFNAADRSAREECAEIVRSHMFPHAARNEILSSIKEPT